MSGGWFHGAGLLERVEELTAENERLREQLRLATIDQANTEAELNEARKVMADYGLDAVLEARMSRKP